MNSKKKRIRLDYTETSIPVTRSAFVADTGETPITVLATKQHSNEGRIAKIAQPPTKGKIPVDMDNGIEIKRWGDDNLLPQRREEMVMKNTNVASLLSRKAEILVGRGLIQYVEGFEDGKRNIILQQVSDAVAQWCKSTELFMKYMVPAAMDYDMHAGFFVEIIRELDDGRDGLGPVKMIRTIRAKYMRACKKIDGKIKYYAYCNDWQHVEGTRSSSEYDDIELEIIPAYDPDVKYRKSILYIGHPLLHDGYYYHPPYWGASEWIEVANAIPEYHKYALKNGYKILYQITFPEGYFMNFEALHLARQKHDQAAIDDLYANSEEAKKTFLKTFEDNIGGHLNNSKSIHTEKVWNKDSQQFEKVEIELIDTSERGKDLLELFEKTLDAIISGIGIPPTLANLSTPGRLGSGSETRNLYNYYIATATYVPRVNLLRPIDIAIDDRDIRPTPTTQYGFEDFIMSKLDDNKEGGKTEVNA